MLLKEVLEMIKEDINVINVKKDFQNEKEYK